MLSNKAARTAWRAVSLLMVFAMLLGAFPAAALAQATPDETGGDPGAQPAAADFSVGNGEREVGAYWQDYYDSGEGDLPNAQGNVMGFYNTLRYHPWTWLGFPRWCNYSGHDCYSWGNSAVWEDDFVDNNNSWVDKVDLVFYEGHGWPGGFTVRPPDDYYVQVGEVDDRRWGNVDLEYMFLLSCSVLAAENEAAWSRSMGGLHLLGGFANTAYDVGGFGNKFATQIIFGYNYKDAWFTTCDTHQPSGVLAKVLAEDSPNYSETAYYSPYAFGVNPPVDGTYWWWTKWCGKPTHGTLAAGEDLVEFPVLETPPLSLAESERVFDNTLLPAFFPGLAAAAAVGATTATTVTVGESWVLTDTTGAALEMDIDTGSYYYYTPKAFTSTLMSGAYAAAVFTEEDARQVAETFLKGNGLMPGDAQFAGVEPVLLQQTQAAADITGAGGDAIFQELTTYEVIYNRYIQASVPVVSAASGEVTTVDVSIPIDGENAKVKVYVSPTGGASAAWNAGGQQGAVVAAQGGWRNVVQQQAGAAAVQTIPLLPYEKIKLVVADNFLAGMVAFNKVPFPTEAEVAIGDIDGDGLDYIQVGYEGPKDSPQGTVFPAYRVDTTYTADAQSAMAASIGETVTISGYTWIPGNAEFMSPLALAKLIGSAPTTWTPAGKVQVEAADASQTLAANGFDAGLDFVAGSGPFTYDWYLNTVSAETKLGSGRTPAAFSLPAPAPEDVKEGQVAYKVILVVTDVGSQHPSLNTSQDTIDITLAAPLFLPSVSKNN